MAVGFTGTCGLRALAGPTGTAIVAETAARRTVAVWTLGARATGAARTGATTVAREAGTGRTIVVGTLRTRGARTTGAAILTGETGARRTIAIRPITASAAGARAAGPVEVARQVAGVQVARRRVD